MIRSDGGHTDASGLTGLCRTGWAHAITCMDGARPISAWDEQCGNRAEDGDRGPLDGHEQPSHPDR
jgi:hypothetical protein